MLSIKCRLRSCIKTYIGLLITIIALTTNIFAQSIQKGTVDARKMDIHAEVLELNGEWEFYDSVFLSDSIIILQPSNLLYKEVPSYWSNYKGFATYRAVLLINKPYVPLAIHCKQIASSVSVWINRRFVGGNGVAASSPEGTISSDKHLLVSFLPDSDTLEIWVQVANYNLDRAGVLSGITIGPAEKIKQKHETRLLLDSLLIGNCIFIAIYHIVLFFLYRYDKSSFVFGFAGLFMAVYLITATRHVGAYLPDLSFEYIVFTGRFFLILSFLFLIDFIRRLFPEDLNVKIVYSFQSVFTILLLLIFVWDSVIIIFRIVAVLAAVYFLWTFIQSIRFKRKGAIAYLIGVGGFIAAGVHDILYYSDLINGNSLILFGWTFFLYAQTLVLASRFAASAHRNTLLNQALVRSNKNLEDKITERTEYITNQRNILEQKNKELEITNKEVTESITYASRIQQAVFPYEQVFSDAFDDYFIFWKPVALVSGDFYWLHQTPETITLAVADSTGHGVPGAFMSLLGITLLNEIARQQVAENPADMLDLLRLQIKKALKQDDLQTQNHDGIDMALCQIYSAVDSSVVRFTYAGAFIPLFIVENDKIIEVRPDRNPVGVYLKETPFLNNELHLNKGSRLYMATDGYADQMGGENNKKFTKKQLKDALLAMSTKPMPEQKEEIKQIMIEWQRDTMQMDDMLVVGIKV